MFYVLIVLFKRHNTHITGTHWVNLASPRTLNRLALWRLGKYGWGNIVVETGCDISLGIGETELLPEGGVELGLNGGTLASRKDFAWKGSLFVLVKGADVTVVDLGGLGGC